MVHGAEKRAQRVSALWFRGGNTLCRGHRGLGDRAQAPGAALRWNGVANLDMLRCAATGATMVLEINPRYWATLLGSVHARVNFPYLACLAALGHPFPPTKSQPITYADQSTAIKQMLKKMTGRPHLAGLKLRNTALWTSLTDPLPTATYYGKSLLKMAVSRATKPFRRLREKSSSP